MTEITVRPTKQVERFYASQCVGGRPLYARFVAEYDDGGSWYERPKLFFAMTEKRAIQKAKRYIEKNEEVDEKVRTVEV